MSTSYYQSKFIRLCYRSPESIQADSECLSSHSSNDERGTALRLQYDNPYVGFSNRNVIRNKKAGFSSEERRKGECWKYEGRYWRVF